MKIYRPRVVGAAGRKRSGKDTFCDALAAAWDYEKIHIAEPWLRQWCAGRGIDYELDYLLNKEAYRAAVQKQATLDREFDPMILLRQLQLRLDLEPSRGFVVSGLRFINEALWFIQRGYLVALIEVDDETRKQRFIESGTPLSMMLDPFESELVGGHYPYHVRLNGTLPPETYPAVIADAYNYLWDTRATIGGGDRGQ